MPGANVQSLEALAQFRLSMIRFQERAGAGMETLRLELQRALQWIDYEQPQYWREQVRKAFERLAAARASLETCQARVVAGNRPSCIEEKVALRRAKERLELAQQKVELTRKWSVALHQAADDFRARTASMSDAVSFDLPVIVTQLELMLSTLEGYLQITSGLEVESPTDVDLHNPQASLTNGPPTETPSAPAEGNQPIDNSATDRADPNAEGPAAEGPAV